MIFINENGTIKRADGKDINEVVIKNKSQFETVGDPNVVYIAKDENKIYRYDTTASDYVLIGGGGGGESYDAGNGIIIENGTISIDGEVVATKEDLEVLETSEHAEATFATKTELAGKEDTSNKISTLAQATDNTKYLGAKVVKDELQNVREVAEGKTDTYVLSYNQTAPTEETFEDYDYYKLSGEKIESWAEFVEYVGQNPECANSEFNSNDDVIQIEFGGSYYLLCEPKTPALGGETPEFVVIPLDNEFLKVGTNILVIQTEVPDRWVAYQGGEAVDFNKLETAKVDLSNYVDLSSAQTITGRKTFNDDIILLTGVRMPASAAGSLKYNNGASALKFSASSRTVEVTNNLKVPGIIEGATQSADTDDIINGTFNVINASDIASGDVLTDEQMAKLTSKPTIIKGTYKNYIDLILYVAVDIGSSRYNGKMEGTNIYGQSISDSYGISSTKKLNLSSGNLRLQNVQQINGKNIPSYPSSPTTPQVQIYDTDNTLKYVNFGGTITSTSTTPSLSLASGNEYEFTNPLTSLNIVSLETSTGDKKPRWEVVFTTGENFTITLPNNVIWKGGNSPTFEEAFIYRITFRKIPYSVYEYIAELEPLLNIGG